jgi:phosphoglycolate phosphatase
VTVELVVFDWDGTLVDSTGRIAESLHRAAVDTGLPVLPVSRYRSIIGLGLPEALQSLYPDSDEQTRQTLRGHYARHYIESTEADPCAVYEGAQELLELLRTRGIRLAVATGKNRPGLERAFRHSGLADYFVASRTADETASKPHPRMLLELLEEQRVTPSRAVMVGDTAFDLDMARRARVAAIGITHGAHPAEQLLACEPVALVEHLSHIPPVLDGLTAGNRIVTTTATQMTFR